jgi:hypothetical protein
MTGGIKVTALVCPKNTQFYGARILTLMPNSSENRFFRGCASARVFH